MPPEQEDLNRQLEALRRHIAAFQRQRDRTGAAATAAAAPAARRPSGRWLALTGLLVALALAAGAVAGAAAGADDRGGGGSTATTRPPAAGAAVASPACKTAVDRANRMLAVAVRLRRELAEYRRILGDPATRRRTGEQLAERSEPLLRAGSGDPAAFDRALDEYRQVVDQCRLLAP